MKIAVKSGRSDLYGSTRSSSSREHASRPSSKRTSSRRTRGDRETDRLLDDDDDSLKGQRRSESTLQYMAFIVIFLLLVNIVTIKAVQYARSLDPEAQEQIRTEWEQEVEEHRNRSGQMQEERETIEADYKTMRETRNKWNDEDSQWIDKQHEWNREDREWEEKKKHEVYLDQRWEERQRQEEDKRNAFHWNYPRSDGRCRGYGLREYEAALVFVGDGSGVDPLLGCVSTPIEIHGEEYQVPDYCEIKVSWSGAPVEYIGHWTIGDESGCNTYWDTIRDKGCTSYKSGIRRYEANLMNLRSSDDWQEMCATTPADYNSQHFVAPNSCAHWGKYGVWGIWFVKDDSCA